MMRPTPSKHPQQAPQTGANRAAFRRPPRTVEIPRMVSQNPDTSSTPRFSLGNLYATSAVVLWASQEGLSLSQFIDRHHCGDWGDLDTEDKQANEDALVHGGRIFSSYLTWGRKIYVITESNHLMTTILFADEY